jgi:hypothetical protein
VNGDTNGLSAAAPGSLPEMRGLLEPLPEMRGLLERQELQLSVKSHVVWESREVVLCEESASSFVAQLRNEA